MKPTKRSIVDRAQSNKVYINKGQAIRAIKAEINRLGEGIQKPTAGLILEIATRWQRLGNISFKIFQEIEEDPTGSQKNLI